MKKAFNNVTLNFCIKQRFYGNIYLFICPENYLYHKLLCFSHLLLYLVQSFCIFMGINSDSHSFVSDSSNGGKATKFNTLHIITLYILKYLKKSRKNNKTLIF